MMRAGNAQSSNMAARLAQARDVITIARRQRQAAECEAAIGPPGAYTIETACGVFSSSCRSSWSWLGLAHRGVVIRDCFSGPDRQTPD
jgi:hypothetical protein